jgi:hypothetical protein
VPKSEPAFLPAPPAPTSEEWQLASTCSPRNSKRYHNAWGQQVRSMMGTAVEGPDQRQVRFRIEIAPDGKVAKVATREHRPPPPAGCPPDSTADMIEEEEKSFSRQMDQWRWGRSAETSP